MHLWVYIVESFFFMVKILMVHGDVISWVTGLLQCKTIISILFNFCGDIHLWVGVTQKLNKHWSPTNNEDSSVHVILGSSQWITPGCNADITQSNDTMQNICTVSSSLCWLSVFYMFFYHDCLYQGDWFVYGKEGFVSFGLCWVNILFLC